MIDFLLNHILWVLSTTLVPLVSWSFWFYIKRPKISIEVMHDGTQSRPKGYLVHVPVPGEENVFDARESQQEFKLNWLIKLTLRNFSSRDALTPKIFFYNVGPKLRLTRFPNSNDPLPSKSKKDIDCKYVLYETKRGQDRSETRVLANEIFKGLGILLEYKDEVGLRHYSFWHDNECKYSIFKPLKYDDQDLFKLPEGIYKKTIN